MMYKLAVVLAVVCFIQAIQSLPVDDLTPKTRLKLEEAIAEAKEAKRDSLQNVEVIRGTISRNIKIALRPIEEQLDDIKDEVKEAEKDADDSEANIEECLEAVEDVTHHFNDDVVKVCKKTKETQQALDLVEEIDYQLQRLHQAISVCESSVNINKCVVSIIKDANAKIAGIQEEISTVLAKSKPEDQDKCISDGVTKLKAKLNKAVKKFRTCVAANNSASSPAPSV